MARSYRRTKTDVKKINRGGSSTIGGRIFIDKNPIIATGNVRTYDKSDIAENADTVKFEVMYDPKTGELKAVPSHYQARNPLSLLRVKGIGEEYQDLLRLARIINLRDLAHADVENLYQKLVYINQRYDVVNRLPSLRVLQNWQLQAKNNLISRRHFSRRMMKRND